jgi:BCD family chlorophyll transporter-like MFS transporter
VQATAGGTAIAAGGALRDFITHLALAGDLGSALADASVGYSMVYHIEILLLFATLVVLGPLARQRGKPRRQPDARFGLAEFPS